MSSHEQKWFANRGQMLQIAIAALALVISGQNAWKDLMASHFLSWGAFLFYALVGLVVLSFVWMVRSNQVATPPHAEPSLLNNAPKLWVDYKAITEVGPRCTSRSRSTPNFPNTIAFEKLVAPRAR